jgi:hypothetical protein
MAANPINVVSTLVAVQYDGTNSGDITALDPGFDFNNDTEVGGVWSFQSPPDATSYTINTGDWILYAQNMVILKNSNSEFELQYTCNALCPDVEALAVPQVQAIGVAPVPTLLLSATANVNVTLQPAMADDTYTAYAHKFAGISLTDLQINSVTVVDEDTVTVAVENVGLATIAGASVAVHAIA